MTTSIDATNSQDAEKMVLGCMLTSLNGLSIGAEGLNEEDFYHTEHRTIFSSFKDLYLADKPADLHIVSEALKTQGVLETIGGIAYLAHLAQFAGTSAYVEEYVEVVKGKALVRRMLIATQSFEKAISTAPDKAQSLLNHFHDEIGELKRNGIASSSLYGYLLEPATENDIAEEIKNTSPGARVGIKLGEVDLHLPGGALSIIAGQTGHGKTLLIINMLLNYLSLHPDKKVWFFSYEESRAAILSLFLNTFINETLSENNRRSIKSHFRDGNVDYISQSKRSEFLEKKQKFFKELISTGRLNIAYCDYSIEELDAAMRFLKKKADIGLIAVDYLQLLNQSSKKIPQRHEEIKEICKIAKNCAVDTGLPVVVAAQFNRSVVNEATMNKLSIGEGGDAERSGNLILGLWNRNENESSDVANIGRNGKTRIEKESTLYLELLKSREYGIGHSTILGLNGGTGKLSVVNNSTGDSQKNAQKQQTTRDKQKSPKEDPFLNALIQQ